MKKLEVKESAYYQEQWEHNGYLVTTIPYAYLVWEKGSTTNVLRGCMSLEEAEAFINDLTIIETSQKTIDVLKNMYDNSVDANDEDYNQEDVDALSFAITVVKQYRKLRNKTKRYVIMVTPEASFSTVLKEGFETIEEATQFILNKKHSHLEKVNEFEFDTTDENEDYVRYNIVEVTI
ncbi:hypothetical protein [uncultured Clostridium sp.]|uniref:hypothetical protein n=1 Tax=uncultured Clostridium sp. TaxID=59620 RepID=UPI00272CA5BE|nr:hypothetical protein [uncultured Clostridium sp.]